MIALRPYQSALLAMLAFGAMLNAPLRADDTPCADPAHTTQKKGSPGEVSRFARPSESPNNVGYWVGGGSPRKNGNPPTYLEGVWGWDYQLHCIYPHMMLNWWHGRYQGGTGAYKTDGPKLCDK
jgi:hypothetical protein